MAVVRDRGKLPDGSVASFRETFVVSGTDLNRTLTCPKAIVCGPSERDPEHRQTVVNPIVLVEVLSDSTEDYDRTDKFDHYKQIPSLQHYVLVSHREHTVEVWSRAGDAWSQAIVREGASAVLSAIGASLDVRQLYARASEPV